MNSRKYFILNISIAIILITYSTKISKAQKSQNKTPVRLEPESAIDIDDPPWNNEIFPNNVVNISEVLEKGVDVPYNIIYDEPKWKRLYKAYWHSSISDRWSYVPNRIHYAMHRLFATYPTASIYYDFVHNLGIADESIEFKQESSKGPYDYLTTVVMQSEIRKIITYGNQVIIVSKPKRNGLQVFNIPMNKIVPSNENENILIQLVTELGDEIDYFLIRHVNPRAY